MINNFFNIPVTIALLTDNFGLYTDNYTIMSFSKLFTDFSCPIWVELTTVQSALILDSHTYTGGAQPLVARAHAPVCPSLATLLPTWE